MLALRRPHSLMLEHLKLDLDTAAEKVSREPYEYQRCTVCSQREFPKLVTLELGQNSLLGKDYGASDHLFNPMPEFADVCRRH